MPTTPEDEAPSASALGPPTSSPRWCPEGKEPLGEGERRKGSECEPQRPGLGDRGRLGTKHHCGQPEWALTDLLKGLERCRVQGLLPSVRQLWFSTRGLAQLQAGSFPQQTQDMGIFPSTKAGRGSVTCTRSLV